MNPVVAVIAPGMMGAAVGGRLVENGLKVLTSLTGRSAVAKHLYPVDPDELDPF